MKRKSLLVAIMGVLMIFSGSVMSFVTSFAKDVSDTKSGIEEIEVNYKKFKELMESFNGERELIYNDVINDLYIENVAGKYGFWKDVHKYNEFLELYNKSVDVSQQVQLFDLKNYDYLDFNDDGKYMGK